MKLAAAHSKISTVKLAESLGITEGSLRHYFNGRNEPKLDTLVDFAEATGVPVEEFLKRDDPNHWLADSGEISKNDKLSKIDIIDAYLPTDTGPKGFAENIIGKFALPNFLFAKTGIRASAAKIIQVNGSEMAPTLPNGSLVMVDLRNKQPTSQSVLFAYRSDKEVLVRYLEYFKAGEMLVRSSNPTLPTKLYPIQSDDLEILGRVVWSCQVWPESK